MIKKIIAIMLCAVVSLCSFDITMLSASAVSYPEIKTTLVDNSEQLGSKKTFDVWARNSANEKIKAVVKLNGETVAPTWDDSEKSSYTLLFTKEGENIITVSASSDGGKKKELTYHISYRKAKPGEEIGRAVWSIELFTIGCGFLVYPVEMPVCEGETAAEQLLRLLRDNGFVGYYNGTPKSAFYIGYIADGTSKAEKYDNYSKSGAPQNPKKLDISPNIPPLLTPFLEETMTYFDPNDYSRNRTGYLGEFVFTNGSGWMYSVNGTFPNVGFADEYLSDGDVVRVQYTLAYGADIGGLGALGSGSAGAGEQPESGYYVVANKDKLCKAVCRARSSGQLSSENVQTAYQSALSVMAALNASQSSVDNAVSALNSALSKPSSEKSSSSSKSNSSSSSSSSLSNSSSSGSSSSSSSASSSSTSSSSSISSSAISSSVISSSASSSSSSSSSSISQSSTVSSTESLSENEKTDSPPTTVVFVIIGAGAVVIAAIAVVIILKIRK